VGAVLAKQIGVGGIPLARLPGRPRFRGDAGQTAVLLDGPSQERPSMKLTPYILAAIALAACAAPSTQRASATTAPATRATIPPGEVAACEREVVRWPMVRKEVKVAPAPDAPEGAHQVRMSMVISATGTVSDVQVVESAGPPFDDLAKTAMAKFDFSPGLDRDERPVVCRISYRYVFMSDR
jgi:TonB family protein